MVKVQKQGPDYKGPLLFSGVLAAVAGVCTFFFATGGWVTHRPRFDLAFIAAGVVFIIALMVAAILTMTAKDNEDPDGIASHKAKKNLSED